MKLYKLTYALLCGAMMASCADDIADKGGANDASNVVGSTGYIGVSIGMPSSLTTRGVNDNFNDGDEGEYSVNSVAVLFFKGDTEEGAKFYKAYNITNAFTTDGANKYDQITSENVATFPVDFAKDADQRLWALAVLNFNNVMTISQNQTQDGKEIGATVTIGRTTLTDSSTIEDVMKLTVSSPLYTNGANGATNFFMTNTPYCRVQGGVVEPAFREDGSHYFRVLADVDRSKIYETKEDAEKDPATEIFVERAVAKVHVEANTSNLNSTLPEGVEIDKIEWIIDNTEPTSYIIRNLEQVENGYAITSKPTWASLKSSSVNNYRFIGNASFKELAKYRTYFCADPNGEGLDKDGTTTLNRLGTAPAFKAIGADQPQYCYENTFSVENMNTFNTTCCTVKVTYKDKNGNNPTFYTIGLNNKQMFTFENAARNLSVDVISDQALSNVWKEYFENLGKPYDNNVSTLNLIYDDQTMTAVNAWMKITFSNINGRLLVTDLHLYDGDLNDKKEIPTEYFSADAKKEALARINSIQEIKAYTKGVSYYTVLIKHFGDELTPWKPAVETTNTTAESYPGFNDAEYLGRYGVVRNNWYRVTISGINNFGEPTYKDLKFDGTPDDKVVKEESIACKINIMSWAVRNQNSQL